MEGAADALVGHAPSPRPPCPRPRTPSSPRACVHAEVIDGCTPEELRKALEGRTIVKARRKGKYLWLELDSPGPWPLLHFGR